MMLRIFIICLSSLNANTSKNSYPKPLVPLVVKKETLHVPKASLKNLFNITSDCARKLTTYFTSNDSFDGLYKNQFYLLKQWLYLHDATVKALGREKQPRAAKPRYFERVQKYIQQGLIQETEPFKKEILVCLKAYTKDPLIPSFLLTKANNLLRKIYRHPFENGNSPSSIRNGSALLDNP